MKSLLKKSLFLFFILSHFCLFAQGRPDALKLYRERNYKEAARVCEEELADSSRSQGQAIESYVVLCWALVADGQYKLAEKYADDARSLNSREPRLLEIQAEAKYYLEKYSEALNLLQQYVVITNAEKRSSQRLGLSYWMMGEIYIRQKKYEHADIALSKAVDLESDQYAWWARLGYAREQYAETHRDPSYYQDAIVAYDKSISISPSSSYDAQRGKVRCQSKLQ